jgi:hypothetical protein
VRRHAWGVLLLVLSRGQVLLLPRVSLLLLRGIQLRGVHLPLLLRSGGSRHHRPRRVHRDVLVSTRLRRSSHNPGLGRGRWDGNGLLHRRWLLLAWVLMVLVRCLLTTVRHDRRLASSKVLLMLLVGGDSDGALNLLGSCWWGLGDMVVARGLRLLWLGVRHGQRALRLLRWPYCRWPCCRCRPTVVHSCAQLRRPLQLSSCFTVAGLTLSPSS